MATIVTVACNDNTKKCTGKITGKDATLTDQDKVNSWLNSIDTVNSKLPSASSASSASEAAAAAAGSAEPPAGSVAGAKESASPSAALVKAGGPNAKARAALVTYGQQPLRTVENTGFAKLYASLPSSSKVNLELYFKIINNAERQQLFQAFNKITEDTKRTKALVAFAELTNEKRNNVIQQLTDNPSANLLEMIPLIKGGRKTRTSHKRRKASKKTRKAQ